jgi:hypothetical protein
MYIHLASVTTFEVLFKKKHEVLSGNIISVMSAIFFFY